jgi:hypothetical protein
MTNLFKGTIIKESLEDVSILFKFNVLDTRTTNEVEPSERWTIHTVEGDTNLLKELSRVIKPNKWYAHFWNSNGDIVVVYRDKTFDINYYNKGTWKQAIDYGISIGIPVAQLDFPINSPQQSIQ